ncbi:alpha/beta hydrolase [Nocardioides sp. W7]|uniref:alpha/beta fold hydrolase n=1 Tax=Nocardioides sp. W7 TaxID=2931390 RepID=UPI001FD3919A|nr:alpha/beta hydrolase [Nocardioides sp. W7]
MAAVPGLGLGVEAWRPALAALGAGHATIHLLPGYGAPIESARTPSPTQLAGRLCDRLAPSSTVFALSSSCQLVAHAARLRPDLVRRIVLVGPTTDPRARSWAGLAGLWLRTAVHEEPRQLPSLVRQYRRTTLRSMYATMDVCRHDSLQVTLSRVGCPVVLVRGVRDRIARRDWVQTLAGTAPERVVVEIPAGAHLVPMTHPALFAERVAPVLA